MTFQFIHDLDALTLLVNMVDAPNVGLLLDIWDVVAGGGSLDSICKLPVGQIVAVQAAELPAGVPLAELDDKSRLLPGAENCRGDVLRGREVLGRGRLRRPGHPEAFPRPLPDPPPRLGRQADGRGVGAGVARRRAGFRATLRSHGRVDERLKRDWGLEIGD